MAQFEGTANDYLQEGAPLNANAHQNLARERLNAAATGPKQCWLGTLPHAAK
jgi:hypothetical protein